MDSKLKIDIDDMVFGYAPSCKIGEGRALVQAVLAAIGPIEPDAGQAFPPLPSAWGTMFGKHQDKELDGYTADQMRGYAIDYGHFQQAMGRGAAVREYIDNGTFKIPDAGQDQRAAFEAWFKNDELGRGLLDRDTRGPGYMSIATTCAWNAWQAGRAALTAKPVEESREYVVEDTKDFVCCDICKGSGWADSSCQNHCSNCGGDGRENDAPEPQPAQDSAYKDWALLDQVRHELRQAIERAEKAESERDKAKEKMVLPDIARGALQALCIAASQESASGQGIMSDWDRGYLQGQFQVFKLYVCDDITALNHVEQYIADLFKLNDDARAAQPAPKAGQVPVWFLVKWGLDGYEGFATEFSANRHVGMLRDWGNKDATITPLYAAPAASAT